MGGQSTHDPPLVSLSSETPGRGSLCQLPPQARRVNETGGVCVRLSLRAPRGGSSGLPQPCLSQSSASRRRPMIANKGCFQEGPNLGAGLLLQRERPPVKGAEECGLAKCFLSAGSVPPCSPEGLAGTQAHGGRPSAGAQDQAAGRGGGPGARNVLCGPWSPCPPALLLTGVETEAGGGAVTLSSAWLSAGTPTLMCSCPLPRGTHLFVVPRRGSPLRERPRLEPAQVHAAQEGQSGCSAGPPDRTAVL